MFAMLISGKQEQLRLKETPQNRAALIHNAKPISTPPPHWPGAKCQLLPHTFSSDNKTLLPSI